MTEYDSDETDLGTMVSEKLTIFGAATALLDILVMGAYLAAALYFVKASTSSGVMSLEFVAMLAVGLLMLEHWLRDWMRVTHPNGHYEYERIFKKEGKTTVLTSVHLLEE